MIISEPLAEKILASHYQNRRTHSSLVCLQYSQWSEIIFRFMCTQGFMHKRLSCPDKPTVQVKWEHCCCGKNPEQPFLCLDFFYKTLLLVTLCLVLGFTDVNEIQVTRPVVTIMSWRVGRLEKPSFCSSLTVYRWISAEALLSTIDFMPQCCFQALTCDRTKPAVRSWPTTWEPLTQTICNFNTLKFWSWSIVHHL